MAAGRRPDSLVMPLSPPTLTPECLGQGSPEKQNQQDAYTHI